MAHTSGSYFQTTCSTWFIKPKSRACVATIATCEFLNSPAPLSPLLLWYPQHPSGCSLFSLVLPSAPRHPFWIHRLPHIRALPNQVKRCLITGCPLLSLRPVPRGLFGILLCFPGSPPRAPANRHPVVVSLGEILTKHFGQSFPTSSCFLVITINLCSTFLHFLYWAYQSVTASSQLRRAFWQSYHPLRLSRVEHATSFSPFR